MDVRLVYGQQRALAIERLEAEWGGPVMTRGVTYRFDECEVWMAGEMEGLAAVCLRDRPIAEMVAINAFVQWRGIGSALLAACITQLPLDICTLRLTTTNDNIDALRFYQRKGFRMAALRAGAVDEARAQKPSIPSIGEYGLPIRDEIDLILLLRN
jgi:GNAT superfamily N-acetyltransferase